MLFFCLVEHFKTADSCASIKDAIGEQFNNTAAVPVSENLKSSEN